MRLLTGRDFNDFSLGPFTTVQDQINALPLFFFFCDRQTDRTMTARVIVCEIYIAISSSSSRVLDRGAAFYVRDHCDSYCPRHDERDEEETLDRSFFLSDHALLIQTSRRTAFLASEIGKWFRDLEISPDRPSESRAGLENAGRWHRINRRMHKYSARIAESIPDWTDKCFPALNISSTNKSGSLRL